MTNDERKQAIEWLVKGYDMITIAQHFNMTRAEFARALNTESKS